MSAMKSSSQAGAQDRKTLIVTAVFAVLLIGFGIYAYTAFAGNSTPAAVPPPVIVTRPSAAAGVNTAGATTVAATGSSSRGQQATGGGGGLGVAAGVQATKMASASASLDPTLDEAAMLRTESLVYSGTGRNIFSATYEPPPPPVVKNVPPARPATPIAYVPPVPQGPPPPPPINLKFFGVETRSNGRRQAFLLQGDDVYLASEGDIVARKYKIKTIGNVSVQVEDMANSNTQTLPLQAN